MHQTKHRDSGILWLFTVCLGLLTPMVSHANLTLDSYHDALQTVERALESHGGVDAIQTSGVIIELEGSFDLSARFQGRSMDRPEPTPIKERMVVDLDGKALSYDIDWFNYYSSNQRLREVYDSAGRLLFLDHLTQGGGYLPRETVVDAQKRFYRVLPNLLLADALEQRHTLQDLGNIHLDRQEFHRISYVTDAGDALTLYLDQQSNLLSKASAVIDMPLLGDTQIEWRWSEYKPQGTLQVPGAFHILLSNQPMKVARMSVSLGLDTDAFLVPKNYDVAPRPQSLTPLSQFIPYSQRDPVVEVITPGVYMVRDLRPGFRLMFVEFDDFVLAVDSPAGWYEMQQIPPMNWSYGDGSSALGEKYLRAIQSTVSNKPVKYLVLTHHHSDHIGGLRPFVAEGVEILAGKNAATVARRAALAPNTLCPDALSESKIQPKIQVIKNSHTISDDNMEVRLIELPNDNPKAENYLMVYLPKQKILYTTAFVYPVPESAFPPPESVNLSLYFLDWLDASGLEIEKIYNVHGNGLVEDWQLERLRELALEL